MQNRPGKTDAGILRPPTALKKVRVGNEEKDEQAYVHAGHGFVCVCCSHGCLHYEKRSQLYGAEQVKSTGAIAQIVRGAVPNTPT